MSNIINKKDVILNQKKINEINLYAVYFLLKNNKIVYIGKTENSFSRIVTHIKEGIKDFDSYVMFPANKNDLEKIEADNIIYHKPIYNKNFFSNFYIGLSSLNKRCREQFGARNIKLIKKILKKLEDCNKIKIIKLKIQEMEQILISKNDIDLIMSEIKINL